MRLDFNGCSVNHTRWLYESGVNQLLPMLMVLRFLREEWFAAEIFYLPTVVQICCIIIWGRQ